MKGAEAGRRPMQSDQARLITRIVVKRSSGTIVN
jgi:hypothetical protein